MKERKSDPEAGESRFLYLMALEGVSVQGRGELHLREFPNHVGGRKFVHARILFPTLHCGDGV